MARDIELKPEYWVEVSPEDFEYGRGYRLTHISKWDPESKEGHTPVMVIPNTGANHNIETDSIAKSNYRVIERDESMQDKVAYAHGGHGFEAVIVPTDRQPAKEVVDILSALDSYPILDEMDYSEVTTENESEDWESWGRKDFIKDVLAPAVMAYAKASEHELDKYDVEGELEDNNAVVDKIWFETMQASQYTETGDSTDFNFRQVQSKLKQMDDDEVVDALQPAFRLFGLDVPEHIKSSRF